MSNEELFQAARAWVARHYPGKLARKLSIELDAGEQVLLPVPAASPASVPEDQPAELRDLILEALAESDRPLKAVLIARRCRRPYSGHFSRTLRELVDAGDVLHDAETKTYRLTD